MKQIIFDSESPKGRIVEIEEPQIQENSSLVTTEERIEALESAILELAGVILNG